ncbi:MAG TPA: universal stress protein [Dehalococcoidia bacterium]|nr:universal stress protein [Dehalococcoidia bacterium]
MYKEILVPLDGSELAEVALPYAEQLAGRLGSAVTLLHVCESADEKYRHMHELYLEKMVEATKSHAEKLRNKTNGKAVRVKSALLDGHVAEQIVDYADSKRIGLIIMATHGRSGIRRWVLGDVAAKVVRATQRPVVLIRAEGASPDVRKGSILKKALVPLDGSSESEAVIPYIEQLAPNLDTEVILLQVVAPAYFAYSVPGETIQMYHTAEELEALTTKAGNYLENVVNALKEKGIKAKYEIGVGAAADEIIRLADEMRADVVAMSTHGRSGISRWAFGSTADKVLHAGNTPVMLVRAQAPSTE